MGGMFGSVFSAATDSSVQPASHLSPLRKRRLCEGTPGLLGTGRHLRVSFLLAGLIPFAELQCWDRRLGKEPLGAALVTCSSPCTSFQPKPRLLSLARPSEEIPAFLLHLRPLQSSCKRAPLPGWENGRPSHPSGSFCSEVHRQWLERSRYSLLSACVATVVPVPGQTPRAGH